MRWSLSRRRIQEFQCKSPTVRSAQRQHYWSFRATKDRGDGDCDSNHAANSGNEFVGCAYSEQVQKVVDGDQRCKRQKNSYRCHTSGKRLGYAEDHVQKASKDNAGRKHNSATPNAIAKKPVKTNTHQLPPVPER